MAKATIPVLIDWNSIKDYMAQNDVIQVVRCKDCKWVSIIGYCDLLHIRIVDSYKYCAWAEREEE